MVGNDEKRGFTVSFNPTTIIATIIVVGWIAAFFLDTYVDSFERPTSLDPLMLLVGGFFLARDSVLRNQNGPQNSTPNQPIGRGDDDPEPATAESE